MRLRPFTGRDLRLSGRGDKAWGAGAEELAADVARVGALQPQWNSRGPLQEQPLNGCRPPKGSSVQVTSTRRSCGAPSAQSAEWDSQLLGHCSEPEGNTCGPQWGPRGFAAAPPRAECSGLFGEGLPRVWIPTSCLVARESMLADAALCICQRA